VTTSKRPEEEPLASESDQAARVRRVIVSVEETEVALVFYRDVLHLTVAHQGGDLTSLRSGEGLEILLHRRPVEVAGPAVALGFTVDDLESTIVAWTALGGPGHRPARAAALGGTDGRRAGP
jgi:predicted enzyme related to lactoylglutathione lyase